MQLQWGPLSTLCVIVLLFFAFFVVGCSMFVDACSVFDHKQTHDCCHTHTPVPHTHTHLPHTPMIVFSDTQSLHIHTTHAPATAQLLPLTSNSSSRARKGVCNPYFLIIEEMQHVMIHSRICTCLSL